RKFMSAIYGNLAVTGNLQPTTISQPANSVGDANIQTPAAGASGIQTSKTNKRYHVGYDQPEGTPVVTESRIKFITKGTAAVILAVNAALKVACIGAATITVDV